VMDIANRLKLVPLVCVVGPSGAGKSSFVQAGVVPALPAEWTRVVVRPGPAPVASLTSARNQIHGDMPAVVVIDQLEELFTLTSDTVQRHAFVEQLRDLVARPDTRVMLTLRDDFLMAAEATFGGVLSLAPGLHLLRVPSRTDLLRMLTEPVRRVGYAFEDPTL